MAFPFFDIIFKIRHGIRSRIFFDPQPNQRKI